MSIFDDFSEKNISCIIQNSGTERIFYAKGVSDLFRLYKEEPDFLRGSVITDKVVGKGAAVLMAAGGAVMIHAGVISVYAAEFLDSMNVEYTFEMKVPSVINRKKTDMCPLEKLLKDDLDMDLMLAKITEFAGTLQDSVRPS